MSGWKNWKGKKITAETEQAFSEGLLEGMTAVGEISDSQVPHDTGHLSETKTILVDPNNHLHVQLGYGGGGQSRFPEVPYAIRWHENRANFQKGRKANYVRDPIRQHGAKKIKAALNKKAKQVW